MKLKRKSDARCVFKIWKCLLGLQEKDCTATWETVLSAVKRHHSRSKTGLVISSETLELAAQDELIFVENSNGKRTVRLPADHPEMAQDYYCFSCHKSGSVYGCSTCWRSYHKDCDGSSQPFICSMCKELSKETTTKLYPLNVLLMQLAETLKVETDCLHDLSSVNGIEEGLLNLVLCKTMDLNTIVDKAEKNEYDSLQQFLADCKLLLHNMAVIFPGRNTHVKYSEYVVERCKSEMRFIESCEDCYFYSNEQPDDWFTKPCRPPHPLVLAQFSNWPYWPAKVLGTTKFKNQSAYHVRFFGEPHERAKVPVSHTKPIKSGVSLPKRPEEDSRDELGLSYAELRRHMEILAVRCSPDVKLQRSSLSLASPSQIMDRTAGCGDAGFDRQHLSASYKSPEKEKRKKHHHHHHKKPVVKHDDDEDDDDDVEDSDHESLQAKRKRMKLLAQCLTESETCSSASRTTVGDAAGLRRSPRISPSVSSYQSNKSVVSSASSVSMAAATRGNSSSSLETAGKRRSASCSPVARFRDKKQAVSNFNSSSSSDNSTGGDEGRKDQVDDWKPLPTFRQLVLHEKRVQRRNELLGLAASALLHINNESRPRSQSCSADLSPSSSYQGIKTKPGHDKSIPITLSAASTKSHDKRNGSSKNKNHSTVAIKSAGTKSSETATQGKGGKSEQAKGRGGKGLEGKSAKGRGGVEHDHNNNNVDSRFNMQPFTHDDMCAVHRVCCLNVVRRTNNLLQKHSMSTMPRHHCRDIVTRGDMKYALDEQEKVVQMVIVKVTQEALLKQQGARLLQEVDPLQGGLGPQLGSLGAHQGMEPHLWAGPQQNNGLQQVLVTQQWGAVVPIAAGIQQGGVLAPRLDFQQALTQQRPPNPQGMEYGSRFGSAQVPSGVVRPCCKMPSDYKIPTAPKATNLNSLTVSAPSQNTPMKSVVRPTANNNKAAARPSANHSKPAAVNSTNQNSDINSAVRATNPSAVITSDAKPANKHSATKAAPKFTNPAADMESGVAGSTAAKKNQANGTVGASKPSGIVKPIPGTATKRPNTNQNNGRASKQACVPESTNKAAARVEPATKELEQKPTKQRATQKVAKKAASMPEPVKKKDETPKCVKCGVDAAYECCSRAKYCSQACQCQDWPKHRNEHIYAEGGQS